MWSFITKFIMEKVNEFVDYFLLTLASTNDLVNIDTTDDPSVEYNHLPISLHHHHTSTNLTLSAISIIRKKPS